MMGPGFGDTRVKLTIGKVVSLVSFGEDGHGEGEGKKSDFLKWKKISSDKRNNNNNKADQETTSQQTAAAVSIRSGVTVVGT